MIEGADETLPDGQVEQLQPSTLNQRSAQNRQQATGTPPVTTATRQFSQAATSVVTRVQEAAEDTDAALHATTEQFTGHFTPNTGNVQDQGAARFAINTEDVAPQQITATPEPSPVTRIVSGLLAAIGFGPAATNAPVAPVSGPTLLGALGLIRRELEHLFVNKAPDVAATPTSLQVTQGNTTTFTVPAVDADGDRLTYTVADGPYHGTSPPPY